MNSKPADLRQSALRYAFLLLKFRARSEEELVERLRRKNFSSGLVKEILSFLKDRKFIDDQDFARGWIAARLEKPYGLRRIIQELKAKGIDDKIIARQINGIKEDYREAEIVLKIVRSLAGRLQGIEPEKAKRRLYAYLLRRGFSPETVIEAINNL